MLVRITYRHGGRRTKFPKTAKGSVEEINLPDGDSEKEARSLLEYFNNTLSKGELPRRFIRAEKISDEKFKVKHSWGKTSLVTERGGYDRMRCEVCGITGKRYGLGQAGVKRDGKYKAAKYEFCKGEK